MSRIAIRHFCANSKVARGEAEFSRVIESSPYRVCASKRFAGRYCFAKSPTLQVQPDLGSDSGDFRYFHLCSLLPAFLADLFVRATVALQRRLPARQTLPALNHHIHVFGIKFDAPANAFSDLCGGQGRPRSEEGVVASLPTLGVIQQRTPHQIDGFLGRMIELFFV